MVECERCGTLCDPEDTYWVENVGWVCENCYQWYMKHGYQ